MHYEVPNLTSGTLRTVSNLVSVLYEYTNKEQDVIKNAFRIGTFNSIRDLPNEITPFAVTHNLKVKVQDTNLNSQITSHNSKIYREILKQNGGVFQKFGWMPD
jgi:hypothetical protein